MGQAGICCMGHSETQGRGRQANGVGLSCMAASTIWVPCRNGKFRDRVAPTPDLKAHSADVVIKIGEEPESSIPSENEHDRRSKFDSSTGR